MGRQNTNPWPPGYNKRLLFSLCKKDSNIKQSRVSTSGQECHQGPGLPVMPTLTAQLSFSW